MTTTRTLLLATATLLLARKVHNPFAVPLDMHLAIQSSLATQLASIERG